MGYLTVINCAEWTKYIKNHFDQFTRQMYLDCISPSTPSSRPPTKKFTPPYGLTFASFADDVGVVDKKTKTHAIDAGHMNRYLIIPEIVYHLSTKLQMGIKHDHLGQDTEAKLIEFLTQFGYATRKSPTVQLHAAHMHYSSDVNETKYIQGTVSITSFLLHCSWYCLTMHASPFDTTKPLICSYQR